MNEYLGKPSGNHQLVLLRHGESLWNKENRFTGWTDVDLSSKGFDEAKRAGALLKQEGFVFDVCYASVLTRAIRTAWIALDELDLMWIPLKTDWRLNERHYGALQGLNKSETTVLHGEGQVFIWRRSYDVPPPALAEADPRNPRNDPRYAAVPTAELPLTEALKNTVERFVPIWQDVIAPDLRAGKRVLIVAHGNSIRALIKYLEDTPIEELVDLNIPTAVPLLYELSKEPSGQLRPISRRYLGDQGEIDAAVRAVAAQAKSKDATK